MKRRVEKGKSATPAYLILTLLGRFARASGSADAASERLPPTPGAAAVGPEEAAPFAGVAVPAAASA